MMVMSSPIQLQILMRLKIYMTKERLIKILRGRGAGITNLIGRQKK